MTKNEKEVVKRSKKMKKEDEVIYNIPNQDDKGDGKIEGEAVKPFFERRGVFRTYFDCLKKYAVFKGRAGRFEYSSFLLVNFLLSLLISFLAPEVVSGFYSLAVLLPAWAVAARRLHDTNKSGWKLFWPVGVFALTGVVLFIVAAVLEALFKEKEIWTDVYNWGLILYMIVGGVWMFVIYFLWLFKKGDEAPNQYGEVPNPVEEERTGVIRTAKILVIAWPLLGIISVLFLAGYQKAVEKFQYNRTYEQVAELMTYSHGYYTTFGSYDGFNNDNVRQNGLLPAEMYDKEGVDILHELGGEIYFAGEGDTLEVVLTNVDERSCHKLLEVEEWEFVEEAECLRCEGDGRCLFVMVTH